RLRPAALPGAVGSLGAGTFRALQNLDRSQLRRALRRREPSLAAALILVSFALGAIWVVALNSPGI
ncbi:MAG: hypothetical protein ACC660_04355, partial [Acidimicrobiales bacterium]